MPSLATQPGLERCSGHAQRGLDGMAAADSFLTPGPTPDGRVAEVYNLLFAMFPGPQDGERIGAAQRDLLQQHGLRAQTQRLSRLHVTLCSLGTFDKVPHMVVEAAMAAANGVTCPALQVMFDKAQSFKADGAFALYGPASTDATVARLRRPLMAALRRHGLKKMAESRTPHMTLVYGCGAVVPACAIAPLAWTARRFSLVLSHVGCTHHEHLADWPLTAPT